MDKLTKVHIVPLKVLREAVIPEDLEEILNNLKDEGILADFKINKTTVSLLIPKSVEVERVFKHLINAGMDEIDDEAFDDLNIEDEDRNDG